MKTLPIFATLVLCVSLSTLSASAQKPEKFLTLPTITVFSADAAVRIMDAHTTRSLLENPCHCFKEDNTAWASGTTAGQYAYSLGFVAIEMGASYMLHRHHHDRLARALPTFDIVYDGHAVLHNSSQSVPRQTGFVAASAGPQ